MVLIVDVLVHRLTKLSDAARFLQVKTFWLQHPEEASTTALSGQFLLLDILCVSPCVFSCACQHLIWDCQPGVECNTGLSPEKSPENKTGIVRCDLIYRANNFKEITTMPARSLCQNFLNNILAPLHLYRKESLIDATNTVINGAPLTLTSIGRHLTGTASVKNKMKWVSTVG